MQIKNKVAPIWNQKAVPHMGKSLRFILVKLFKQLLQMYDNTIAYDQSQKQKVLTNNSLILKICFN